MPTPLEILLDPVSLYILAMYFILIVWEAVFPAHQLPYIAFWKLKGILFFFMFFFLSSYLPLMYEKWLPTSQLIDLSHWGLLPAGLFGIILYELGVYTWHRAMHNNNLLWRIFHQMHHSAERLDTYGAFYFSLFDMVGFTVLGTVCFSFIAGLSPQSITIVLLVTNFFSIFQHANIKTPKWLGYFIQRPESHAIHHARGIHAYNYSDLPLFDLVFGTFKNPGEYKYETGFYEGASDRILDMHMFRDINLEDQKEIPSKRQTVLAD